MDPERDRQVRRRARRPAVGRERLPAECHPVEARAPDERAVVLGLGRAVFAFALMGGGTGLGLGLGGGVAWCAKTPSASEK